VKGAPEKSGKERFDQGDAFELIKLIPTDSIDLIVTSPPYNIGKAYETREEMEVYLGRYESFASECFRVLKPNGNLVWQVGNFSEQGEVIPLDIAFYPVFKTAGFKLRNRIIWHFRHGMHARFRLSGRYETLLWFAKDSNSIFNLDPIRIPNLYPGKRVSRGPRRGQLSGNPKGKNPGDFWPDIALEEWELGFWDIPNVKAHHPEKTSVHPCQFPVELIDRCVLALSNEGDTVLDPFMGVGSAAVSAIRNNRNFIGFEFSEEYILEAQKRIEALRRGTLKVREPGTPIKKPTGRIAETPSEWRNNENRMTD
jgi:adenine-specific DNA-methyltransferase